MSRLIRLQLSLFLISFVVMGFEMIAVRLVTPYFGNTIYTWGAIISVFLVGASIGYTIGGKAADHPAPDTFLRLFLVIGLLSIVCLPYVAIFTLPLFSSFQVEYSVLFGAIAIFLLPNTAWGAVIPILMKEGLSSQLTGKRIGNFHTLSSFGSVAGTLATTYFFIPLLSIPSILAVFAGCLLFITMLLHFSKVRDLLLFIPLLLSVFLPLLYETTNSPLQTEGKLIHRSSSSYHDLFVVDLPEFEGEKGHFRFLLFEANAFQGGMDVSDPEKILLPYTQDLISLAEHFVPGPRSVYMIGHGIGTLTSYFERTGSNIEVAEIDPKVVEISRQYFTYKGHSERLGDGRLLLNEKPTRSLDLILTDAYRNNAIPFHLTTKEFYELTKAKLKENGVLLINLVGQPKGDPVTDSIVSTLREVYPFVRVYAARNFSPDHIQNLYLVASAGFLADKEVANMVSINVGQGEIITDHSPKATRLQ